MVYGFWFLFGNFYLPKDARFLGSLIRSALDWHLFNMLFTLINSKDDANDLYGGSASKNKEL